MFGGQPVKMNFSELFKLTLAREKFVRKFCIHQQFYDIDISHLPYHLDNASSMAVLPELFKAIFDICTKTFEPSDRITIELQCKDLDPSIYLPAGIFRDFSIDRLLLQMEKLNSQKKFKIDESFRAKITKISLPGGGGKRRINMYPLTKRKRAAHSIVTVSVGSNLCLPACLYLGKFRQTHDVRGWSRDAWINLTRADRNASSRRCHRTPCRHGIHSLRHRPHSTRPLSRLSGQSFL